MEWLDCTMMCKATTTTFNREEKIKLGARKIDLMMKEIALEGSTD
jgi:hypothetical protein